MPATRIAAKLNAERARLGMFAAVTVNREWSSSCAKHNRWMHINHRVQHPEIKGTRGASKQGHWAGTNSVLASDGIGWRHANPWINAPIHLSQVYNPLLRTVGASDAFGHSCMTTWPGMVPADMAVYPAVQQDHVFTLPGNGERVPYAQMARENPYVPQQKVGIREGRTTGPYLYVWSYTNPRQYPDTFFDPVEKPDGSFAVPEPPADELALLQRLTSATLRTASGEPVKVKLIDDKTVDGYLGAGNGFILPVRPLRPNTRYTATVTLASDPFEKPAMQRQVQHTWTFKTTRKTLG